jgi:hypothetical protein
MLLVHVDLGRNIRGVLSFFLSLNQGSFALSKFGLHWWAQGSSLQSCKLRLLGPISLFKLGAEEWQLLALECI